MARRISTIPTLVTAGILAIAAAGCASSGSTPAASAPASAAGAASAAASTAGACAPASGQGQVAVSIKDFAFNPATITAKVGQTITFTNQDTTDHTATVSGGACTTGHITPGSASGLTFSAPGTYAFACAIHPSMTGTITVS